MAATKKKTVVSIIGVVLVALFLGNVIRKALLFSKDGSGTFWQYFVIFFVKSFKLTSDSYPYLDNNTNKIVWS